jgi:hypothetical protein
MPRGAGWVEPRAPRCLRAALVAVGTGVLGLVEEAGDLDATMVAGFPRAGVLGGGSFVVRDR